MRELVYELKGLSCANCAMKIEEHLNRLDGVDSAQVVFATQKLNIKVEDGVLPDEIVTAVKKIVGNVEPGVKVLGISTKSHSVNALSDSGYLRKDIIILASGMVLFAAGLFFITFPPLRLCLLMLSYLITGADVLANAVRNISRGRVFDENFLMGIATIGAMATGQYPEAAAVMLFYKTGMLLQNIAVNNSRKSISSLMDLRPEYANLVTEDGVTRADPGDIRPGETVLIKPGERVPLDCTVTEGDSFVDTSALTGEAVPRGVKPGDRLFAGYINKNGLITAEVTNTLEQSAVSRILDLVQNAASKKAKVENFITKFAAYYTPAVVISALLTALLPPLASGSMDFKTWIYRALIFLVIACPCALVVSIPLTYFAGIGKASSKGILVKGSNCLEAINNVNTVVFDKTGTLTKGIFKVTGTEAKDCTSSELLEYAALAEAHSSHPVARSIIEAYGKEIDEAYIKQYEEIPGCGVKASTADETIIAGNLKLLQAEGVTPDHTPDEPGTIVHIAVNGRYSGYILVSDMIKSDAAAAVAELRQNGISRIAMLTGDVRETAEATAKALKLDEVHFGLLPHQKVEILEKIKSETKGGVIFAGDGINDAPVLAGADIGVSMGALGSDAAIEASDIVLMTDEPSKLVEAVKIARKTRLIASQNIAVAIGVKLLVLLLGSTGHATMWEAVFADVGVTLLAIFNALRIIR